MDRLSLEPPQPVSGRRRVAWPLDMWPVADRDAWSRARQSESLVSDAGAAEDWRPASIKSVIGAHGRWLAYLAGRGELDMDSDPADRFTRDSVNAYVDHLRLTCSSVTVASYIAVLSMTIQAMVPERDWTWLRKIQANLHHRAEPSRDKRPRVVHIVDLLELGLGLMVEADASDSSDVRVVGRAARDFRDGLMIALLAMRPLRQKNFLAIEIGSHQVEAPRGNSLRFSGKETKDKKPFQAPFPAALESVLARYLAHYRPILVRSKGGRNPAYPGQPAGWHLWVSKGGTTFTAGALQKALERHTRLRFGHVVNTHLFRDCVATTIAYDDPEHIRICARILGHSRFSTTEGHYIAAKMVAAADHYHELIEAIRSPRQSGGRD